MRSMSNRVLGTASMIVGVAILSLAFLFQSNAWAADEADCKAAYCSENCEEEGLGCTDDSTCDTAGAQCTGCEEDGCYRLGLGGCICGEV